MMLGEAGQAGIKMFLFVCGASCKVTKPASSGLCIHSPL